MPAPVPPGHTRGPILFLGATMTPGGEQMLLQRFWTDAGGYGSRILLVAADPDDRRVGMIASRLRQWEAELVDLLALTRRSDAQFVAHAALIEHSTAILIVNGAPHELARRLGGTPAAQAIRRANARGKTVAALGASAAILCQHVLVGETPTESGHAPGLGLINRLTVAPVSMALGSSGGHQAPQLVERVACLVAAIAPNPFLIGVSLGFDTGVAVYADATLEVFGQNEALLLDGADCTDDNLDSHALTAPPTQAQLAALGIHLHHLTAGYTFNFDQRSIAPPAETELPGPDSPEFSKSSF